MISLCSLSILPTETKTKQKSGASELRGKTPKSCELYQLAFVSDLSGERQVFVTVTAKDKTVQDYSELQVFARNFEESDTGLEPNSSSSCLVGVQEIAELRNLDTKQIHITWNCKKVLIIRGATECFRDLFVCFCKK